MSTITAQIQLRRDTSANWTSNNPTPLAGEICITTDVFYTSTDQPRYKIGDGVQTWTQLDYVPEGSSFSGLTTGKYIKATSATTVGNAILSESGNNVILPTGKFITSTDTAKAQIDLSLTGVDGDIRISTDGGAASTCHLELNRTNQEFQLYDGANYIQSNPTRLSVIHATEVSLQPTTLQIDIASKGASKVLTSDANGFATWQTPAASGITSLTAGTGLNGGTITSTGTIALNIPVISSQGGTGQTTYAVGDLLYSSGTTNTVSLARLADVAAGSYLRSGGVNTAPLWSTLVLPNSATVNRLVYATSSNTWGDNSLLTFDGTTFTANGITANASGLGLGTGTASSLNGISGIYNDNSTKQFTIQNTNTSTAARCGWVASNSTNSLLMYMVGTGFTTSGINTADSGLLACGGTGGLGLGAYNAAGAITFYTGSVTNLRWTITSAGVLTAADAINMAFGTTTGTKIGTATSQKIGFWNATPIVQPTTAVSAATLVGGGGTTLTDTDTFDGYTLKQVVKALRNTGILA